ncbi:MAG: thioredoxin family protein [Planctomycetota bacterium]|jgi:thiol-disulfide isomerase/thioredoxin|nr:thioredoxin family protein [Planctomycetota bacterium]
MRLSICLTAACLALAPSALAGSEAFLDDFDEAVALARAEKKDLFVDFTGSDWCGWCIKLDEEVFSHEAFLVEAQKDFVLVALDYPRGEEAKAAVPNPERNDELREEYGIRGYPTCLLMTADGDVYGRTGYLKGGPEQYVEHLRELRASGRKSLEEVIALVKRFDAAQGEARVAVWEEAVAMLESLGPDSAVARRLAAPVKAALEFDPDNAAGRKLRAIKALMGAGLAEEAVLAAARELDPKNEAGLLEQVVAAQMEAVDSEEAVREVCKAIAELDALGPIKDPELAFRFYLNAAAWNDRFLEDAEAAKKFAAKAKAIGTENERILELLDGILDS